MRKLLIALALVALLVAGGWAYITFVNPSLLLQNAESGQEEANGAENAESAEVDLESVIWASGKLLPTAWANLAPLQGGVVQALQVKEGDWVETGAVLLLLDNQAANSEADIAAAAVMEAEAVHARLLAGASEADIAAAEAGVASADAQVSIAAGRLLEAQNAVEFTEVEALIAQEQYNDLASGPTAAERAAAAARVEVAQAALDHAQAAYNAVRGDPSIGSTRLEALLLQQATKSLEAAQAEFAVATQGPTQQKVAVSQARIQEALSRIAVAESTHKETANKTKTAEILSAFQSGTLHILIAKRVLDEGVNIPQVRKAYILASTTVERQWTQRRGRLLRRCDQIGKTHSEVHDFVALPPSTGQSQEDRAIMRSELRRVQEFASLARNAGRSDGPLRVLDVLVKGTFM